MHITGVHNDSYFIHVYLIEHMTGLFGDLWIFMHNGEKMRQSYYATDVKR